MSLPTTSAPSSADRAMSGAVRDGVVPGAVAGLVGGVAFGASMIEQGELESIASLVRADSLAVAAVVHMAVALVVGAAFGLLVFHQRATAADTLVWGIAYGALFWFVGPLTLRPLILGDPVLWDMAAEAEMTRARRAQLLTSAPALWAFVVFLPVFVAIVLSPVSG